MKEFKANPIELKALLNLAKESLDEANNDLRDGFVRGAISSSYYCFLHLMRALLLQRGIIVKSHQGVKIKFSQGFILTGKINKKFGKVISDLFEDRLDADYAPLKEFTKKQAEKAIRQAEEFYKVAEKIMLL